MAKTDPDIDDLVRIIEVIGHDLKPKRWFKELAHLPDTQRRNEIFAMTERMRKRADDANIARVFGLLVDARMFEAGVRAIEELE